MCYAAECDGILIPLDSALLTLTCHMGGLSREPGVHPLPLPRYPSRHHDSVLPNRIEITTLNEESDSTKEILWNASVIEPPTTIRQLLPQRYGGFCRFFGPEVKEREIEQREQADFGSGC
jgi:hypothetical protein